MVSGGSVLGAAISLSITTIGAGVLVLPSVFQDAGIILVLLTIAFVSALTVFSLDYLVVCVERLHLKSYEDISRELLGRTFEEIIRWMIIIYLIGIAAGYIFVIGEIFTPVLPLIQPYFPFMSSTSHVTIAIWTFIMLPLSLIPHIHHLNYIALIGIGSTFFISFIIVYRYFVTANGHRERNVHFNYFSLSPSALIALPVIMFSFDCQTLVFQIYANLKNRSRHTMLKVSCLSVLITGTVYATVGLFGYISHAGTIRGNILNSYNPLKDHLFALGECIYSLTIMIAYVLVIFPCRDAVFILLHGYNTATHDLAHDAIPKKQTFLVSFLLACLSLFLALRASGLVFIIALLGGLCSSTVCFIYPAAFRLAMHFRGIQRCTPSEHAVALLMLVFGLTSGIFGTVIAFAT